MYNMEINKELLDGLLVEAKENPRLRQNFDFFFCFEKVHLPTLANACSMLCSHKLKCLFIDMKRQRKL